MMRMTNQTTRRYQIWSLAPKNYAEPFDTVPVRREPLAWEKKRYSEQFGESKRKGENTAAGSTKAEAGSGSLYHYGLPIEIELPGLCSLPNGRTAACMTTKISSDAVTFVYDDATPGYRFKLPQDLPVGTPMHLDLERIGEFHGALASQSVHGFKIAVAGDCKEILSNRLAVLAAAIRNAGVDEAPIMSKTPVIRLEPDVKNCRFTDASGVPRKGWIINVSRRDALIKAPVVPPVNARIVFAGRGHYEAEVNRAFEIGFAVNFLEPIPESEFSAAIKFLDE
jgi:hypothetical protein